MDLCLEFSSAHDWFVSKVLCEALDKFGLTHRDQFPVLQRSPLASMVVSLLPFNNEGTILPQPLPLFLIPVQSFRLGDLALQTCKFVSLCQWHLCLFWALYQCFQEYSKLCWVIRDHSHWTDCFCLSASHSLNHQSCKLHHFWTAHQTAWYHSQHSIPLHYSPIYWSADTLPVYA